MTKYKIETPYYTTPKLSYLTAQEQIGAIIDRHEGENMDDWSVQVFMSGGEYPDYAMSLNDFIDMKDPDDAERLPEIDADVEIEVMQELSPLEKERLQHLSDVEKIEVLKHASTGFLIAEIARRFDEYANLSSKVAKALDDAKLYTKE